MFSIDFSRPLPRCCNGEKYLLMAVKHLTDWAIVKETTRDTSYVFQSFVEDEIHFTFGLLRKIISDNARCFTSSRVQTFMDINGIQWKPVLQYTPMSNGKVKRVLGAIKQSIKQTTLSTGGSWPKLINQVVYGYLSRLLAWQRSPFFLVYGVQPRLCSVDSEPLFANPMDPSFRLLETLSIHSSREIPATRKRPIMKYISRSVYYKVGDMLWVANGKAIRAICWVRITVVWSV